MAYKGIVLALSIALVAAPAHPAAAAAAQKPAKGAAAEDQRKYCIAYDNVVGSRVTRQECKTRREWAREGVDVERMLKGQ